MNITYYLNNMAMKVSRRNYKRAKVFTDELTQQYKTSYHLGSADIDNNCSEFQFGELNRNEEILDIFIETADSSDITQNLGHSEKRFSLSPPLFESSASFCSSSSNNNKSNLKDLLSEWAIKNDITHSALNELLVILRTYDSNLPKDARTIIHTPRKINTKIVEPGHYYHFGLEKCINNLLQRCDKSVLENLKTIDVLINIDGLPLTENPSTEAYPILCTLIACPNFVDMVGIYQGKEKPDDSNKFLEDFTNDAVRLTENGILFNNTLFSFKIKGFVCDVPARSFILKTKGHSGYYSCFECDIKGSYYNDRVCFPDKLSKLRTDQDFRARSQPDHHNGTSVLEQIPDLDMISDFPCDPMHLFYLGVVKKMTHLWSSTKPSLAKLSSQQIDNISSRLHSVSDHIPCEFNRKARSLNVSHRWKATECRQFILYSGPVVLKNIVNQDVFLNFITLHVALTILSSPRLHNKFIDSADAFLKYFVDTFEILYGKQNISHNFHSIRHACIHSKKFGTLDGFSAWCFENYMQSILKLLRKQEKPLEQIVLRKLEHDESNLTITRTDVQIIGEPYCVSEHWNGPLLNITNVSQYEKIIFPHYTLSIFSPNNCCVLKDGTVIIVENILMANGNTFVTGRKFNKISDFYTQPCLSTDLGICLVSTDDLGNLNTWNIREIETKCAKLKYQNDLFVVFPLLHI